MAKTYTAEEVAQILQEQGLDITKRTVNYYAFEKNMFKLSNTGRSCFTDAEIEKIKSIALLKEYTKFTLAQIKTIINTKSYEEIKKLCVEKVAKIDPQHYSYITQNQNYIPQGMSMRTGQANYRNDNGSAVNGFYLGDIGSGSISSGGMTSADGSSVKSYIPDTFTGSSHTHTQVLSNQRRIDIDEDFTLLVSERVDESTVEQIVNYIEFVKAKGGVY